MENVERVKTSRDALMQLVSFTIGDEVFGVDILRVQEVNKMAALTHLPGAPDYVDGVIAVWGKKIPVVNLRRRFGMPAKEWDDNTRIIVVESRKRQIGFIVDTLQEIVRVPAVLTEPASWHPGDAKREYVVSVARLKDRLLNMFDLERVFGREEGLLNKE